MNIDKHLMLLGQLVGSIQSLEFSLRIALYFKNNSKLPPDLQRMKVGDIVTENQLTNYDTLGELINKYNHEIADVYSFSRVDEKMVALRDAIAHGRVTSSELTEHSRLIKFNKPEDGKVTVTFSEEMNFEWISKKTKEVIEKSHSIIAATFKIKRYPKEETA